MHCSIVKLLLRGFFPPPKEIPRLRFIAYLQNKIHILKFYVHSMFVRELMPDSDSLIMFMML